MIARVEISVTPAMKADFDACMAVLRPDDSAPFKADVRDVIAGYGRDYAAAWLRGWRATLVQPERRVEAASNLM